MQRSRPKNLNFFTIHFPLTAILSILHRITGVIMIFLIPVLLLTLQYSFTEAGFSTLQDWFGNVWVKTLTWLFLMPFCFHLVAGIRHLLMDIHIGTSLNGGRLAAILTVIIAIVAILLVGIWLW